jgi:alkylated DNA repair protein (DNA oxidative demethylase)
MRHLKTYLDAAEQQRLLGEIRGVLAAAPLYTPAMPRTGRPFSVRMTNCGPLGWVADKDGYRYQAAHPVTGAPWPAMPAMLAELWAEVTNGAPAAEACLVNYYAPSAKMGLHRDEDEEAVGAPVVSVSLGDTALFRLGGTTRKGPTRSLDLESGDVIVLEGDTRLAYHGVDRIRPGTSDLLLEDFPEGGRINLTLRRVTPP